MENHIPWQRIHLDIASVNARSSKKMPLIRNYEYLPNIREAMQIRAKTKESILADKVVAFVNTHDRSNIRWRDLWDIWWLTSNGVKLETRLVEKRIQDFPNHNLNNKINESIERIPVLLGAKAFVTELSRFLPREMELTTIKDEGWRKKTSNHLSHVFTNFQYLLVPEVKSKPDPINDLPDPFEPPTPFNF